MHIFCQARGTVCVSDLEIYATNSLAAGKQVLNKLPFKQTYSGPPGWGLECGADHSSPIRKHLLAESTNYIGWKDRFVADKAWLRK